MATEDCSEAGRGPCPCGQGEIVVERCTPDHAWVKAHQVSYNSHLDCSACGSRYTFFSKYGNEPERLVLRTDVERRESYSQAASAKRQEVASSSEFKTLEKDVTNWLAQGKSAAARHRMLVSAGLSGGMPLQRFRKSGFTFDERHVLPALDALKVDLPTLKALALEANRLWGLAFQDPPAIKTGIPGLEQ